MKIKAVIGILLIALSIGGIYLWETRLRDQIVYTNVLVAATDIEPGDIINENSFCIISVNRESLVEGYLNASDSSMIIGKRSNAKFKQNSQLYEEAFFDESYLDPKDSYTVNIPTDWISIKNADIIPGNIVDIYQMPDKEYLGSYIIKAIDPEEDKYVEIQCCMSEYFAMYDYISKEKGNSLLLVANGSIWD